MEMRLIIPWVGSVLTNIGLWYFIEPYGITITLVIGVLSSLAYVHIWDLFND